MRGNAIGVLTITIALLAAACTTFRGENESDAGSTSGSSGSSGTGDPDAEAGADPRSVRCRTQADCVANRTVCCTRFDNKLRLTGTICIVEEFCKSPERLLCSDAADCKGTACAALPAPYDDLKGCELQ